MTSNCYTALWVSLVGFACSAQGTFAPTDWPTSIDPAKFAHFYVTDGAFGAPNENWTQTMGLLNDGDQAMQDAPLKGFTGRRATSNNINVSDSDFAFWNTHGEIDVLVQVYGNINVLRPNDPTQSRRFEFLTGTLPGPSTVTGGTYATNAYNLRWNWILFTITNNIILDGTGDFRQVGTVKPNAVGNVNFGGINGGTIRLQGPDNNVNSLAIHAVAFGEKGVFGTAEQINQFEVPDVSCAPVPNNNLVGIDLAAGTTNHLQILNDAANDQGTAFNASVGPANDKRKAVVPTGTYLNFGILDHFLGQPCNEAVAVKVCVDFYDDPAFAGLGVIFGPESYASDESGNMTAFPVDQQAALEGSGRWIRRSWTMSGVNLSGISTAPLTGGPRFISTGGQVAVSRVEMAVLRTSGPLAGQDPLADCYADPAICDDVYGNFVELDLKAGVTNGLDLGTSGGDQAYVVEQSGPTGDLRDAVRGDGAGPNYNLNFQILTNTMGPTTQGNVRLAIAVTYYDDPANVGAAFRPQVWRVRKVDSIAFNYLPDTQRAVLQGTGKWREAYWEIGEISFDGVNQGPQAAARFEMNGQIHIARVRYAVVRPCGTTAGVNPLVSPVALTAGTEPDARVKVSWPYQAPQAVLQRTPTLGGTWTAVPGAPTVEGEESVMRLVPEAEGAAFFRLFITAP